MKIYTVQLKRNDIFLFYKIDGIFTCVNDDNHIMPITSSLWEKGKGFTKCGPPHFDRLFVPSYRVHLDDKDYFLKENVLQCVQSSVALSKETNNKREYNCFVPYKNLEDGTVELGVCTYEAVGRFVDEELTGYIEKQFKLKAFW